MEFARYGFNKAHACGYALQAYQDMWLKVHYPLEFYAAQLTYEPKKMARCVREMQSQGIRVLPPDINASDESFTIDGDAIRFGLLAIKNVGETAVTTIIGEREQNGPFRSMKEFEERVPKRKATRKVKDALIDVGAFDCFGMRQMWEPADMSRLERELVGFSLSRNTMVQHRELIRGMIDSYDDVQAKPHRPKNDKRNCACAICRAANCTVGGEVASLKVIRTKRTGAKMAFAEVAFGSDVYECTFFPEKFTMYESLLEEGVPMLIKGMKGAKGEILVEYACSVEALADELAKRRDGEAA
jgi:DNA polymerase III alpha subunit